VSATTIPARLDGLKWILTGGFASLFVLGFAYLWLRPRTVVASNGAAADASKSPRAKKTAARASSAPAAIDQPPVSSAVPAKAAETAAAIDNEVRGSLDELKDSIFRLELRRQAGTISEEDYVRERERVEQTLRGLVRG
jgi:hypothetical protein